MSAELTLPQLFNTAEVTIARWLKKAGEQIVAREKLLEVYSDHFDWDIPAPCDGTLQEIRAQEGARVKVGETIATIATVNDQANSQLPTSKSQPSSTRVSPIAAKIAAEHNINLAQVQGGGADGRVTKEDVISFIESRNQPTNDQTTQQANHRTTKPPARLTQDTLIELSTAQRARAERVWRSTNEIPHVTTFVEIDMSAINVQRDALQAAWQRREGFALAHLPYVVLAAVAALRAVPIVNGAFRPHGVVLKKYYSIAVVVPPLTAVISQADLYNLVGVARYLQRAMPSAKPLDATFTIHDHQAGGALLATGIVAPSQAAVLTLGAIQPRARVVGDALQIRPTMFASLSYDHRVIDGIVAGQFLSELRRQLETAAFR